MRASQYGIVTILGPRQSGKTTLCKLCFPNKPYVNLERPDERAFAQADPQGFLARYPDGAVLDEIQNVPQLLSWLQVWVDSDVQQRKGMFILTGSHHLLLNAQITQSLAGRTAVLRLLPLSMEEILQAKPELKPSADALIWQGGYPRIHAEGLPPDVMLADYFATYVERDARQLIALRQQREFGRFVQLLAGRVGQLQNHQSLAQEIGVSSHTIAQWTSVLEASFLVFALPPWHANLGKRLTKSPKFYFHDVGLAAWLIGIRSAEQLAAHPLRGQLFENLVITEVLKTLAATGQSEPLYFFRDSNGLEVDLLVGGPHGLRLIEIKSAQTLSPTQFKALNKVAALLESAGHRVQNQHLVYGGSESGERAGAKVHPLTQTSAVCVALD